MNARKASVAKYFTPNESRRNFIRVDFEPGAKVVVGDASYDALDVSVYGVSFLISPEHTGRFAMGTEIPSLSFAVDGRLVNVSGKVAYLRTGLIANLAKVAVEFIQVSTDDIWELSRHVAHKAGVNEPKQIGSSAIRLDDLKKKKKKKKPAVKAKAKPKTKTKSKAKTKSKSKSKSKAKAKRK